jgi:uncharacterized membrane protein
MKIYRTVNDAIRSALNKSALVRYIFSTSGVVVGIGLGIWLHGTQYFAPIFAATTFGAVMGAAWMSLVENIWGKK